jgi:hypothetical protein
MPFESKLLFHAEVVRQQVRAFKLPVPFCEDRGLLPAESIKRAFEHRGLYNPRPVKGKVLASLAASTKQANHTRNYETWHIHSLNSACGSAHDLDWPGAGGSSRHRV